jgi:hypothetical protein
MPALQTGGAVRDPRTSREGKRMMTLALALALQGSPMPPPVPPLLYGRVYTAPDLHVGVRVATYVDSTEAAYGVTVQITWLHLL